MVKSKTLEPGIELQINRDERKQFSINSSVVIDMQLLGTFVKHVISSQNFLLSKYGASSA